MYVRHPDKVTTATAAGPCLPLWMRWCRQPPIPFITKQEREAKAPEREKSKEVCPDAGCPPGKHYGRHQVLKGQGTRHMPNL